MALEHGHVDIARLLLERGADKDATDRVYIVFCIYIYANNPKVIQEINLCCFVFRLQYGFTPLIWASCIGCVEIARLLVERGANIEATDRVSACIGVCMCVDFYYIN
jgi:ankyrin repeat protein